MGEGVSGASVDSDSCRSPLPSMLMLQAAVSPDIGSPAVNLMVQITLSLNFASHVPANFFLRLAILRREGQAGQQRKQSNRESGHGLDRCRSVAVCGNLTSTHSLCFGTVHAGHICARSATH